VASINRLLERIGAMFDKERRFVAGAAHELRTPITALIVQADNLEGVALSEDGHERLQSLRTGTRRTAHLLEQLLTLAKYDSEAATDPPSSEFDRIVKGVVADLLPVARDGSIDLGFIRVEAVSVHAESVALDVLARNLIDNALRHTPAGGRVDVSVFAENDHAVFQVEDTGPGIPEADLDRIFEPFFRGSRARGQGTGLGLSIVRSIVERCRGSIHLERRPPLEGSGLRVRVRFPPARPAAAIPLARS
jgi:two-component system OmpR family sensor kinase